VATEARELFDLLGEVLEVEDVAAYEALSATSATLAGFFEYLSTPTWTTPSDGSRPSLTRSR
jgi:hypothetical protein